MTEIPFAIFAFVLMISVIVTIHEYGHYQAARWFGLIGTHFSIGFGRKIAGWTDKRGTEWRIAPLLIGGYVKFPDDNPDGPKEGDVTLKSLPRWQRAIVVGAGPGINLLLAALIFALIAYAYGYPAGRPVVTGVISGSPAAAAGIMPGDEITSFNGSRIVMAADVRQHIMIQPNKSVEIEIVRNSNVQKITAKLSEKNVHDDIGNSAKIGFLGVELPQAYERSPTISAALTKGVNDGLFSIYVQFTTMHQIITGERKIMELSGPIRMAKMSAHTLSLGLLPFLYLMALISIAVGIMNLLPIPGLDGGHLLTYAAEGVMRRDLPEAAAQLLIRCGFVIIISMGVLGITLDVIALS